ncbi:MAG: hypothetical protein ACRDSJ_03635 [Rubrobacteraceae bacterium]
MARRDTGGPPRSLRLPTTAIFTALLFLAVVVGGGVFGILGAIFAVPAIAVLRVLFDFFRVRIRTTE